MHDVFDFIYCKTKLPVDSQVLPFSIIIIKTKVYIQNITSDSNSEVKGEKVATRVSFD